MTDQELLLLNNIMYLNSDIMNGGKEGWTVDEILSSVNDSTFKELGNSLTPKEDWAAIAEGMRSNSSISELTLIDMHTDGGKGAMACFETPSGEAVVVFQGTSSTEWKDNFEGGFLPDTAQQKNALDWIDSLPYDDITVTGHSKGGNKAQYVALLSDKIERCVSYDGQGFSKEFIEEYGSRIAMNRDKITSYAVDNDFVNILLDDVSGKKVYLEGHNVDLFLDNHCPDTAFFMDESGKLQIRVTEQGESMERMEGLLNYILNTTSDHDRESLLVLFGDVAQMMTGDNKGIDEVLGYLLSSSNEDTVSLFLAYVYRYEKENEGITDTIREIMCSIDGMKKDVWVLDVVDWLLEQGWAEDLLKGILSWDSVLAYVISKFTDLDKKQIESAIHMLLNMFQKEGVLPPPDSNMKSPPNKKNIYGSSQGFAIDLAGVDDLSGAMLTMGERLTQLEEDIQEVSQGLLHIESGSFRRISRSLFAQETNLEKDRKTMAEMGNALRGLEKLYQRTEKRIISFR